MTASSIPARSERAQGLTAIHLAVFLFGLSGLIGKMLTTPPLGIVFSRALLAAVILCGTMWLRTAWPRLEVKQWGFLAGSGAMLGLHWLAFFQAIQVSNVAIGLLSFSSFPLFTTLLEPIAFRERLRAFDLLTCFLVLTGLIVIIPQFDRHHHLTQGVFWGIASGFCFALLSIVNRRFVRGLTPLAIGAGQNAVAALLLLPFAPTGMIRFTLREVTLLLILGVVCTACAHVLFIRGLATVRAQAASVLSGLEPVYGILLAWLILQETPPLRTLAGGALILGATLLTTWLRPWTKCA